MADQATQSQTDVKQSDFDDASVSENTEMTEERKSVIRSIMNFVKRILRGVGDLIVKTVKGTGDLLSRGAKAMGRAISTTWSKFTNVLGRLWNGIKSVVRKIRTYVVEAAKKTWTFIKDASAQVRDLVKKGYQTLLNYKLRAAMGFSLLSIFGLSVNPFLYLGLALTGSLFAFFYIKESLAKHADDDSYGANQLRKMGRWGVCSLLASCVGDVLIALGFTITGALAAGVGIAVLIPMGISYFKLKGYAGAHEDARAIEGIDNLDLKSREKILSKLQKDTGRALMQVRDEIAKLAPGKAMFPAI